MKTKTKTAPPPPAPDPQKAIDARKYPNQSRGLILNPSAAIRLDFERELSRIISAMAHQTREELVRVFESSTHHGAMDAPDDGNRHGTVAAQSRLAINALMKSWQPKFNRMADKAVKRMIDRTLVNSRVTLGMSLKEISESAVMKTDVLTGRLAEVVSASTNEAASLIKLIPQKYLTDVAGAVSRSITGGAGLADLVPYLTKKYHGNIRWARLVAMDQTRKVYSSITAARMAAIGVQEYEWIHTGGSTHPRPDHIEMSGKVYRLDDPPVIVPATKTRPAERGIPGQAIFCRCRMRPIVSFGQRRAA